MKTRTELPPISDLVLDLQHCKPIVLLGSCFSVHIGDKLSNAGFDTLTNPHGTVYNLPSISNTIQRALEERYVYESEILYDGDVYYHWDVHSSLSAIDVNDCCSYINESLKKLRDTLLNASHLVITLGTAHVYTVEGKIVANCHRRPAKLFDKSLLSTSSMVQEATTLMSVLDRHAPHLKVLWTLSPVRHIKDGMVQNSLSKATCLSAIHEICTIHEKCSYFPSYEIMMDDLRDYRYYEDDMLHPTAKAINYIWDKVQSCIQSKDTIALIGLYEDLHRAKAHRVMHAKEGAIKKHQDYIDRKQAEINSFLKSNS